MVKYRSLKGKSVDWSFDPTAFKAFLDAVWPTVDPIPGFLSDIEAYFLYESARTLTSANRGIDVPPARHVVEIGTYKGRSSVVIGLGLKANRNEDFRLVCVDPFLDLARNVEQEKEFRNHIRQGGVEDIVDVMPAFSVDAAAQWPADRGIAMLWIDGNHEYENVRDDFLSWSRHLVPGGLVAFHDWYLSGVRETILRHVLPEDRFQSFCAIDENLIAARRIDAPADGRLKGRKRRFYFTLQTGRTSLWSAFAAMLIERLHKPFGNLKGFVEQRPDIQDKHKV